MPSRDAVVATASLVVAQDVVGPSRAARLSAWSVSGAKRWFDVALVCAVAPLVAPLLLIVAAAVRLSSPGETIFRQTRIGFQGRPFTILKFRTMFQPPDDEEPGIACASAGRITDIGSVLRKLKLDELPQVLNVLRGDMSLVGPRPRIAAQQLGTLSCRPGVTGAATLAFAREDLLLAAVPPEQLPQFYRDHILPVKHRLDSEYMARATALSDMELLLRTVVGWWQLPGAYQRAGLCAANSVRCGESICGSDPA